jgi:rhamnosyltransferase
MVAYNPYEGIGQRLRDVATYVSHLIVVDNTELGNSPTFDPSSLGGRPDILHNKANLGPATALNIGVSRAVGSGYPYVLILDQDSVPQAGMVQALVEAHRHHPERERVALVAPQPIDPGIETRPRYVRNWMGPSFELVECEGATLENVTLVIASGALLPTKAILALGPFRDDYFIVYIDTEYCLRALARGYKIVVASNARLHHRLGNQKAARLGPLSSSQPCTPPTGGTTWAETASPPWPAMGPSSPTG